MAEGDEVLKRLRGGTRGRKREAGSGTGPILLSQATFLLAHIANSGPVPLRFNNPCREVTVPPAGTNRKASANVIGYSRTRKRDRDEEAGQVRSAGPKRDRGPRSGRSPKRDRSDIAKSGDFSACPYSIADPSRFLPLSGPAFRSPGFCGGKL